MPGPLLKHGLSDIGATGKLPNRIARSLTSGSPHTAHYHNLGKPCCNQPHRLQTLQAEPAKSPDNHDNPWDSLRLTDTFPASFRRQCCELQPPNARKPAATPHLDIDRAPDNRTSEQPLKTPFSIRIPGKFDSGTRHDAEFRIPTSPAPLPRPGTNGTAVSGGGSFPITRLQIPEALLLDRVGNRIHYPPTTLPVPGTHYRPAMLSTVGQDKPLAKKSRLIYLLLNGTQSVNHH